MKIMIIEDEAVIRQGVRKILNDYSKGTFVVTEFDNAKDALNFLQRNIPDLIITDIRMREMDGLTMIGKIRHVYNDIPIIVISGYQDFRYAQQALRYKVIDYLLKPIHRQGLIALVNQIAKKSGLAPSSDEGTQEKNAEQGNDTGDQRRIIRKLIDHIEASPDGDLRLQVLAEFTNMNAAYLSQLFKQETGQNLSDFITSVRIEQAKHLLKTTHLKIYDVAQLSGYQSPKHFMLVFKQHVGMTPSEYRDQAD